MQLEKSIADTLNGKINPNWRPDFAFCEQWRKSRIVVAFLAIKTQEEVKNAFKELDSPIAVKFFGALDFSFDVFDDFLEYGFKTNFKLYGNCNPVFFIDETGIEVSQSKRNNAELTDEDYPKWLDTAPHWISPENDNYVNRSALLLNAYEDCEGELDDSYIVFFSNNIKNAVQFDVMSSIENEGVYCHGIVFSLDNLKKTDDKTADLFSTC